MTQIWNGRTLYLCLSVPHREYVDKRTVFEVDNAWLTGIVHLIFLAFESSQRWQEQWKSLPSYTCQPGNPEAASQSQNCWGRYTFFPQVGFKSKSQLRSHWKLSPLSTSLNNSVIFLLFWMTWCLHLRRPPCQQVSFHGLVERLVWWKTEKVFLLPGLRLTFTLHRT